MTRRILAGDPPHLIAALNDQGVYEINGRDSSPRIIDYYRAAGVKDPEKIDDSALSWCSAAMCCWCEENGLRSTNSLAGRSWLRLKGAIRLDIADPLPRGAIVVLKYDDDPNHGHVAIVLEDNGKTIKVVGGNQSNQVNVMTWQRSRLIGAIWHPDVPRPHIPAPKPKPHVPQDTEEPDPEIPAEPPHQPDDPGVDPDDEPAAPQPSLIRRLWDRFKRLLGIGTGAASGGGLIAFLTDPWVVAVIVGGLILLLVLGFIAALYLWDKDRVRDFIGRIVRKVVPA